MNLVPSAPCPAMLTLSLISTWMAFSHNLFHQQHFLVRDFAPGECKQIVFKAREDKGVRKLISHIGPIPVLIPLKLFLAAKFKFQIVISFEWINIFH